MDQSQLENKIIKIINSQVTVLTGFASSGVVGSDIWVLLDKNFNNQSMIKAVSMNVNDPQRVFIIKNNEGNWEAYGLEERKELSRINTTTHRHYKQKKLEETIKPRFAFLLSRQTTGSVECSCNKRWLFKDGACRPECSGRGSKDLVSCTGKRYSSNSPDGPQPATNWTCSAYITMWQPIKVTDYFPNNTFRYIPTGNFQNGNPPADDSYICSSTDIRPQYSYYPIPPDPPYSIDPFNGTYVLEPPLNEYTRWSSIEAACLKKVRTGTDDGFGNIASDDVGYRYYITFASFIDPGSGPHKPPASFILNIHANMNSGYSGPSEQEWASAQMIVESCFDEGGGEHPKNPTEPPIKPIGAEFRKREFYIAGDRKKPLKIFELSDSEPYNAWLTWVDGGYLIATFRHGCEDSKYSDEGGYRGVFDNHCKVTILKIKKDRIISKNVYSFNSTVQNREENWRSPFINKYVRDLSNFFSPNNINRCIVDYIQDNRASIKFANKLNKEIYYPGYPEYDENKILADFASKKKTVNTIMHKFKGKEELFPGGFKDCVLSNEETPTILKTTIECLFPPGVSYMNIESVSPYIG